MTPASFVGANSNVIPIVAARLTSVARDILTTADPGQYGSSRLVCPHTPRRIVAGRGVVTGADSCACICTHYRIDFAASGLLFRAIKLEHSGIPIINWAEFGRPISEVPRCCCYIAVP